MADAVNDIWQGVNQVCRGVTELWSAFSSLGDNSQVDRNQICSFFLEDMHLVLSHARVENFAQKNKTQAFVTA